MLEQAHDIQERVGTLVNWVLEMQQIVNNPYANGLNMERVLTDLQGFASELTKAVHALEEGLEAQENTSTEEVEVIEAE